MSCRLLLRPPSRADSSHDRSGRTLVRVAEYLLVRPARGPAWDGTIPLAGPIGDIDGQHVVLVVNAASEDEARAIFTDDPGWNHPEDLQRRALDRGTFDWMTSTTAVAWRREKELPMSVMHSAAPSHAVFAEDEKANARCAAPRVPPGVQACDLERGARGCPADDLRRPGCESAPDPAEWRCSECRGSDRNVLR